METHVNKCHSESLLEVVKVFLADVRQVNFVLAEVIFFQAAKMDVCKAAPTALNRVIQFLLQSVRKSVNLGKCSRF